MYLTKSSIEGVLVGILARQAAVLTLQVRTVLNFPDLPNLQHLALDIDIPYEHWEHDSIALFSVISLLKSLTTLFLFTSSRSSDCFLSGCIIIIRLADLTEVCAPAACWGAEYHTRGCANSARVPLACQWRSRTLGGFMDHDYKDHMSTGLTMRHRSGKRWLHRCHASWYHRRARGQS